MRVLVTGGAGFIGSHLVDGLIEEGSTVRVLDNFSTGHKANLEGRLSQIDLVEGDIRDYETVLKAMPGIEVVFHQAALCSVPRSVASPRSTNAVNIDGTLNILAAAREQGCSRVICASYSSAYGHNAALPKREDQTPAPASPYAVTKLTDELYCNTFYHVYGLETFSLRYFNVFGPRQDPDSQYAAVIPKFASSLLRRERPTIFGDGSQSRDFTHVSNVVQANLLAMKATEGFGEAINIGCGQRTTIRQLAEYLMDFLGFRVHPLYAESRAGDVQHSLADIDKAGRLLGYAPCTDLLMGLRQTASWYRDQESTIHAR